MVDSLASIDWNLIYLCSLPIIASAIGWFTNYLAVKMLFRPYRPIKILGLTFQGLVPKRQIDLADKIASTIEANLISHRDIQAVLKKPETEAKIEALITEQIDAFLRDKLSIIPMAALFLQGELAQQIKAMLVAQFRSAIPDFIDGMMTQLEAQLNFRDLVRKKVESFDLLKLEEIIYAISAKELKTIEILGGVLGFAVGIIQMGLLLLSQTF